MVVAHQDFRFEKKWVFLKKDRFSLLNILKKRGFFFTKSFPNRQVNNIYYDTKDLKSLRDNLDGVSCREKLRARWYGDFINAKNIIVEKKIKKNQMGYKEKKKIKFSTKFNSFDSIKKLNNHILTNYSLMKQNVIPILFNSYERIYTTSKLFPDIRCTLDFNLKSFIYSDTKLPRFINSYPHLVLEIKYPIHKDNLVKKILDEYNLKRISKSSKYVSMYVYNKFI